MIIDLPQRYSFSASVTANYLSRLTSKEENEALPIRVQRKIERLFKTAQRDYQEQSVNQVEEVATYCFLLEVMSSCGIDITNRSKIQSTIDSLVELSMQLHEPNKSRDYTLLRNILSKIVAKGEEHAYLDAMGDFKSRLFCYEI